jgi:RNA polymerase sigma-70 factor (ECF subfamily)
MKMQVHLTCSAMENTDELLLRRLATQEDQDAFCTLLNRYADMVYGTCMRILRDSALAADVTQETFFQMFKAAGRITGSPGGWLHQVATRRSVDLVRQNVSRRRREEAYVLDQPQTSSSWAEIAPLVDRALEQLPPEQRDLLVQHYLERKSLTRIAAETGVSQPTVSRRVAEGLEWLRERLRAEGAVLGSVPLQAMLLHTSEAAPEALLKALGKVALSQAATTPVAVTGSFFGGLGVAGFAAAAVGLAVMINVFLPVPQKVPVSPPASSPAPKPPAAEAKGPSGSTALAAAQMHQETSAMELAGTPAMAFAASRPTPRYILVTNLPPAATNKPPNSTTPQNVPAVQTASSGVAAQPGQIPQNTESAWWPASVGQDRRLAPPPGLVQNARASELMAPITRQPTNQSRSRSLGQSRSVRTTAVLGPATRTSRSTSRSR